MSKHPDQSQKILLYAGLAYLFFVVYGSLVPLDYHYKSWDDAVQAFRHIRYLELGIDSRADWIANALLYIPLTFIWSAIAAQSPRAAVRTIGLSAVLLISIALSIGVEFTQIFFPQRTVSLNDIIAEIIGSILGTVLWLGMGTRISRWLIHLRNSHQVGRDAALTGALSLYLLAYVSYSLFPFDFVVSYAELSIRLANDHSAWLFSSASCSSASRCMANALAELIAAIPLGVMIARMNAGRSTSHVIAAMIMGALLGLLIECAQLFLNSGVSQGVSVLTRSIGAGLGALAYQRCWAIQANHERFTLRKLHLMALLITPIYLAGLIATQNWHFHDWLSWEAGLARLPQIHFLPFYYHYFTTETAALASLLRIAASYAPIGFILWMNSGSRQRGAQVSALVAALMAAAFEFAKLFQTGLHPDPTNVLIAASAAAIGYALINWWNALHTHSAPSASIQGSPTAAAQSADTALAVPNDHSTKSHRISPLALAALGALIWAIAFYPLGAYWLAGGALVYLALLRRWSHAWLVLLPAILPVLDLAPWSGRFFFDEFDCLLLATIAIAGWRMPIQKSPYRLSVNGFLILTLLTVSTLAALLIGSYPFPAIEINSFNNYYSPYNALRVGKGLLWALLLLPLLKIELERDTAKAHQSFALGMTLGVLAASVAVLWERLAFTGLLDFQNGYRVVGMFSGMHTGGAYIEGYFATALPFVAWRTVNHQRIIARLFGATVFALGCYALMVTYARGGYIALALGMLVLIIGLVLRNKASFKPLHLKSGLILLLLLIGVGWPALHGSYMQERFSNTQHDVHIRTAHWEDALNMMDDGFLTKLFGMGLGRYPETYFWRNTEGAQPATYRLINQQDNIYLALSAGDTLYFEQIVSVNPHQQYHVKFFANSTAENAVLTLPLCEKWMLYSAHCIWNSINIGNTNGKWRQYDIDIDTKTFSEQPWYAQRTVKLALFNAVKGTALNIDNVSMKSSDGKELVQNGDFANAMDHWFFSTDNHLPWHFKNLWLQIYFEQGALGLLLFACVVVYAFIAIVKRFGEQDFPAPVLAASLVGFLTVGVVDSLFDVPRMALLFYLLVAWALLKKRRSKHAKKNAHL
ncbi:MAG TPA: VanZ family protein [Burkholderiaceae bacterium]|jgi:glycopeptide antibiotics resistance protein